MPFYIFNLERKFPQYETDNAELEELKQEYMSFMAGLDKAVEKGKLSVYYRRVIIDMSKKVLENLARKYDKVRRGVKEIMGGRVLEHEGKTILNQGIAIGEERGRIEANIAAARRLREMGMSDTDISRATNLSYEELSKL